MMIKSLTMTILLGFGVALAGGQACVAASFAPAEKIRPNPIAYDAGKKAADAGDYQTAVEKLRKAVATDPRSADAYNLLGYSYRKLGDTDAAFENYRTALLIDRSHRGAHEYLGELYLETDNLAEAEKLVQSLGKSCAYSCVEYRELKQEIAKYKAAHGG